jgi:hypothetical protein
MALVTANFPDLLDDPVGHIDNGPPRVIGVFTLGNQEDRQMAPAEKEDEDALLDELLDDDIGVPAVKKASSYQRMSDRSDETSHTTTSEYSPDANVGMDEFLMYEQDDDEEEYDGSESDDDNEDEDSEDGSFRSYCSEKTSDILEKAHDRIALQKVKEEMKDLEQSVERKNEEIEMLSGQLRRAVATKCDLVLSHTELERHHEVSLKSKDNDMVMLQKANYTLLEIRAEVEQEFMNELAGLAETMKEETIKHRQEMDDWERMHRNEMLEKDYQLAQLTEQLRAFKATSGQSLRNKKKGFFSSS